MYFTKMQGAGNDFIIINNIVEKVPLYKFKSIAKRLCQRKLSIGADGLIVIDKPQGPGDFSMIFYNSDGSLAEMCGNGARCIARYGYENKLSGEIQTIETTSGIVTGKRIDRRMYQIRLNDIATMKLDQVANLFGKQYSYDYVEMGNPALPHAAVNYPGLLEAEDDDIMEIGRSLRYYRDLPKGANVNFYDIVGEDDVIEKTYERGVEDFTLACGTGTGSTVAVLTERKLVSGRNVHVKVMGGDLYVDIDKSTCPNGIYLTGPTNIVAYGEVIDEELQM